MNSQQKTALSNPCKYAEQCIGQQYREITRKGQYLISCTLTVNVGRE